MVVRSHTHLIPNRLTPDPRIHPEPQVVKAWRALAESEMDIGALCHKLFSKLRKCATAEELGESLLGLQSLAFGGEAAGAALLAAYLDVTTPGARLLPFVHRFSNTRRLRLLLLERNQGLDQTASAWLKRARAAQGRSAEFVKMRGLVASPDQAGLVTDLRLSLECLLTEVMNGGNLSGIDRSLLVDLLTLETDAWQERVSRLAGLVNPYRASAVSRVLPILGMADAAIRDLHQLIGWVQAGRDEQAFSRNGFRALEVIENDEFQRIYRHLQEDPRLRPLAEIHRGGRDTPLKTARLAHAVGRIWALESRLAGTGEPPSSLNLLSTVAVVQQFARRNTVAIPLSLEHEAVLVPLLRQESGTPAEDDDGPVTWSLEGVGLDQGQLIIDLELEGRIPPDWPHGLPTAADPDPLAGQRSVETLSAAQEEEAEVSEEQNNAAVKHLVMSNIMSTSTTLGFLRNPKVVAIPGLVAEVAVRTRNPQIIETIASDRALHTGFANRDVPLVCLRSPCNVSPKLLRKFIHVKYVSKVDLKRMAKDKAGMRKEVVREIQHYLDTLA